MLFLIIQKRLIYRAYFISLFIDIDYKLLLKNMKLTTSEVSKSNASSINQRCDYVCEINGSIIGIEMNNNSSLKILHRNMDYNNKQFSAKVKNSKNYNLYRQSILININNFSFKGKDEVYYVSYIQDKDGTVMTDAIMYINIYLPNLLKKCYTKGVENLDEKEKYLYALVEEDEEKLKSLMKEMPIVKEYVNEAKEVSKDEELLVSYDHEQANMEQRYIYGFEDGIEKGIEKGKKENQIEFIKSLYEKKVSLDIIAECAKLSIEEVQKILKDK